MYKILLTYTKNLSGKIYCRYITGRNNFGKVFTRTNSVVHAKHEKPKSVVNKKTEINIMLILTDMLVHVNDTPSRCYWKVRSKNTA